MERWNILATAQWRSERRLLRILREFGEFKGSGYRDVILGHVEDLHEFLETFSKLSGQDPGRMWPLGQIVPIEKNFQFEVTDFEDKAKAALASYLDQLEGANFFVRMVRRGHKGEISSQEMEQRLDEYILERLQEEGKQATVNIEEFDKMIAIETVGNAAGIGLITRDMENKYPFIRLK